MLHCSRVCRQHNSGLERCFGLTGGHVFSSGSIVSLTTASASLSDMSYNSLALEKDTGVSLTESCSV